jgi:hypothetical protein
LVEDGADEFLRVVLVEGDECLAETRLHFGDFAASASDEDLQVVADDGEGGINGAGERSG